MGCLPVVVKIGGEHVILYTAGYFTGDPYWKINFQHTTDHEVKVGDWVSPNTVISHVGNPAGSSTAGNNHIHLEISWDPNPVEFKSRFDNPMLYFSESDRQTLKDIAEAQGETDDHRGVIYLYEGYNSLTVDYIERGAGTLKP